LFTYFTVFIGHKFQEFYEKEVDGQDGSSLDDSQQFYDDSEQGITNGWGQLES